MMHVFRDDERRRITVTSSGVVSFLDLATFVDKHLAGGAWGYDVLHDARTVITDVTTQTSDIVGHIQAVGGGLRRGPVAVVATDGRYLTTARNYAEWLSSATLPRRRNGWTAKLRKPSV